MELWKDIENYEGLYQISNQGRVKSLARLKSRWNAPEKFLQIVMNIAAAAAKITIITKSV